MLGGLRPGSQWLGTRRGPAVSWSPAVPEMAGDWTMPEGRGVSRPAPPPALTALAPQGQLQPHAPGLQLPHGSLDLLQSPLDGLRGTGPGALESDCSGMAPEEPRSPSPDSGASPGPWRTSSPPPPWRGAAETDARSGTCPGCRSPWLGSAGSTAGCQVCEGQGLAPWEGLAGSV